MSFSLTDSHFKWAVTNFLPEVAIHSKSQDSRIVGEHYNRGNDFFGWFLGEAMVYTAAWFETPDVPLEQAQYKKIDRCCEKLQLKKGETLLDIGCGWGTFVARAAKEFGAKSYGVTLAQEQVDFGTDRIKEYGVSDRAKVEVCDYRNVTGQFDKIVSLEMVEHVGIKNLVSYFKKVHELLKDDGLFVLQWTGIRNLYNPQNPLTALTLRPEDLIWALFMARYIFPGADASLPLSGMLRAAEDGGFEVTDVENMSPHYIHHAARLARHLGLEREGDHRGLRRALVPPLVLLPPLVGAHRRAGLGVHLPGDDAQEQRELRPHGPALQRRSLPLSLR